MNQLANIITVVRIFGVGFIFWMTPYDTNLKQAVVIVFYTLICLTDFLDGWIARRLKIESELGKMLDPLADKILVLVFLPLLEMQVITSFPVFIILAREFAMMGLRIYSVQNGDGVIPAQMFGKIKTTLTLVLCGILLARVDVINGPLPLVLQPVQPLVNAVMALPSSLILGLVYAVVALSIWSFIDYFDYFFWKMYLKRWNNNDEMARQSLRSLVPNFFSISNALIGGLGIYFTLSFKFHFSALLLVACVVLDAIDGSVARKLNATTTLGARLDMIADFISFGILPATIIYMSLQSYQPLIAIGLSTIYILATGYRLRRFSSTGHTDYFEGLPSPFGASIIMFSKIAVLFSPPLIFIGIVLTTIGLMVSKLPYPHRHIAAKHRFLRFAQFPAFIFTLLAIAMLIRGKLNMDTYVYDALVMIFGMYIVSPIIYKNSAPKS